MSDAGTIRFYDRAAAGLADLRGDAPPGPALRRFIDALPPGAAVLDLGCGHGIASARLARAGFDVVGFDASEGLLSVARRLAPGARFVRASFDELNETDAYDGVWANDALLHAPRSEMPRHLAAIARALRPGGLLYLAMLLGRGEARDSHGRAYTCYSAAELRSLLRAAGLEECHAETGDKTGFDGPEPFIALLLRAPA